MAQLRLLIPNSFVLPTELRTVDTFEKLKRLARILPKYEDLDFYYRGGPHSIFDREVIGQLQLRDPLKGCISLISDWQQLLTLEMLNPRFLVYLIEHCGFGKVTVDKEKQISIPTNIIAMSKFQSRSVISKFREQGSLDKESTQFIFQLATQPKSATHLSSFGDFIVEDVLANIGSHPVYNTLFLINILPESADLDDLLQLDRLLTRALKQNPTDKKSRQSFLTTFKSLKYPEKLLSEAPKQWKSLDDILLFLQKAGDFVMMLLWDKIVPYINSYEKQLKFITAVNIPESVFELLISIEALPAEIEQTRTELLDTKIRTIFETFTFSNAACLYCALKIDLGSVIHIDILRNRIGRGQIEGSNDAYNLLKMINRMLRQPKDFLSEDVSLELKKLCDDLLNFSCGQISKNSGNPLLIELEHKLPLLSKVKELCDMQFAKLLQQIQWNMSLFQRCAMVAFKHNLLEGNQYAEITEQMKNRTDPVIL